MRALASHLCGPGSIPRLDVICGLSLLVLYSERRKTNGQRRFSRKDFLLVGPILCQTCEASYSHQPGLSARGAGVEQ